jgi:hypothetical protein
MNVNDRIQPTVPAYSASGRGLRQLPDLVVRLPLEKHSGLAVMVVDRSLGRRRAIALRRRSSLRARSNGSSRRGAGDCETRT